MLPKGTRLYLHQYPTLKSGGDYSLRLWHEKLEDNDFAWWSNGFVDHSKDLKNQMTHRMCDELVLSKHFNHYTMLLPDDFKRGDQVEHLDTGVKGTVTHLLYTFDPAQVGVYWHQGQFHSHYHYNRFDTIRKL